MKIKVVDRENNREYELNGFYSLSQFTGYSESYLKEKLRQGDMHLWNYKIYSPFPKEERTCGELMKSKARRLRKLNWLSSLVRKDSE